LGAPKIKFYPVKKISQKKIESLVHSKKILGAFGAILSSLGHKKKPQKRHFT